MTFIASVWDWDKLKYDYYECAGKKSVSGWDHASGGLGIAKKAKAANGNGSRVGVSLEEVLPDLPANAKKVGSGEQAQGQIMVIRGGLSGLKEGIETTPSFFPYLFAAVAGASVTAAAFTFASKDKESPPSAWAYLLAGGAGFIAGATLAWNTRGTVEKINQAEKKS